MHIADDSPLLSWLHRSAAQVMNKMRIGQGGTTSELRITFRRQRKPTAQFGEKVWFRKIGEDGVQFTCEPHDSRNPSFCHHGTEKEQLCVHGMQAKWDSVARRQMVALELKLTKQVAADKEGAGPPLPRIVVVRVPKVEPRRCYVVSADIEAHGHTGGLPWRWRRMEQR